MFRANSPTDSKEAMPRASPEIARKSPIIDGFLMF
jgi:hypothetical protein